MWLIILGGPGLLTSKPFLTERLRFSSSLPSFLTVILIETVTTPSDNKGFLNKGLLCRIWEILDFELVICVNQFLFDYTAIHCGRKTTAVFFN